MFPTINLRETGVNLHRIMDKRGITPKDIKEFLNLGSIYDTLIKAAKKPRKTGHFTAF